MIIGTNPRRRLVRAGASSIALAIAGIAAGSAAQDASPDLQESAGILVPEGFSAEVFHEGVGHARHLVVTDLGRVYVALEEPDEGGGIAALRDENGDGEAEQVEYFGDHGGTGIGIRDGHLYASSDTAVFRYPLPDEGLVPDGEAQTVIEGFPEQDSHSSKAFAFGGDHIYVNVGAPSNACQEDDRAQGSPGMRPCPLLEEHGGIWHFDADATGQSFEDGERFVTGVRNVVALDWKPATDALYFVQHGRDQLHDLFPEHFSVEQSAELPAEEFHLAVEGADYGWPYTYWDHHVGQRMKAPEYGGDGKTPAEEEGYRSPLVTFPGHWAPNDLLFYTGEEFPEEYRGGAFIAFHGSWNRAPLPQRGYRVVFAPFEGGEPTGEWRTFADGFKGAPVLESEEDAEFRPMGLAEGPDGALYVADSVQGRIWRVVYDG